MNKTFDSPQAHKNMPQSFALGHIFLDLGGRTCTLRVVELVKAEYQKLTKLGGAGSLVPITGFANSVAAPAIEFQKEGQVFGIGCKIFTIAGSVILFGIFSSRVLGLIYWVLKVLGVM